MTTAQLHKQWNQLVRELNDQGLQIHQIEEHPDINRIGIALWGARALRDKIRAEIRRALQTDIDKETGVRNRISIPQIELPMPKTDVDVTPVTPVGLREYCDAASVDPLRQLMAVEEVLKINMGRMKKLGGFLLDSELAIYSKAGTSVLKSVKARLQQSNGSDITID
jgi:hypothetical protein